MISWKHVQEAESCRLLVHKILGSIGADTAAMLLSTWGTPDIHWMLQILRYVGRLGEAEILQCG